MFVIHGIHIGEDDSYGIPNSQITFYHLHSIIFFIQLF